MEDLTGVAELMKCSAELLKGSKELDPNVPEGMPRFMSLVYNKSKKLVIPGLIYSGAIAVTVAATVATGGGFIAAASAMGICSSSIGLLKTMKDIYKGNKNDTAVESKKNTEMNDNLLNSVLGEMSEEISEKIKLLDTSIQSNLEAMSSSLNEINEKLGKIWEHQIHQHDKNIEVAFNEMNAKVKKKNFSCALESLNKMNFEMMKLNSNAGIEKARDRIMEAMKDGKQEAMQMYFYLLGLRQKLEAMIQMEHFLNDLTKSNTDTMKVYVKIKGTDYLQDLEGYWAIMKDVFEDQFKMPTILVIGKCGTGKSSLCNILAGLAEGADKELDGFATSPETASCTQVSKVREICYFGDPRRPLRIIDTPGFDDPTKNHDAEVIAEFVGVLKDEVKEINLLLLAMNGQSPRLENSLLAMIQIICGMFSTDVWDNLGTVFTRVSMDKLSIKKRTKQDPEHDENRAKGFVTSIEEVFKPKEKIKELQYFYMDAHYDEDIEEEVAALEESKEKLWKMISGNKSFDTNHVENVMTEHASLKKELQKQESKIEEMDSRMKEYEKKETDRIQKETNEKRQPVEGFTFFKIRDKSDIKLDVYHYSEYIELMCNDTLKPFKNAESFRETITTIETGHDNDVKFAACDFLSSEKLLNRIPRKHKSDKISQLVFILEISNFTNHFLTNLDIHMEEGNEQPLCVWHADDEVMPSMLHELHTFVIPPYAKERLIFRNSGQMYKTKLQGMMTMNIAKLHGEQSDNKMMVTFKIDNSTLMTNDTSFCVGFPDSKHSPMDIKNILQKSKNSIFHKNKIKKDFYEAIRFSKKEEKNTFIPSRSLTFPETPVAGEFNLSCYFGNARRCKCIVILSKTPEKTNP